jgi:hypothetical protein
VTDEVAEALAQVVEFGDTPQQQELGNAVQRRIERRDQVAGLLSTIDFTPSKEHPARMREWANQVLALLEEP